MTTLYEQINTRKIVLPPELQEFFSTIYDTSKKYEFVYLGKNIAWKPLIASRAPSSEIHKKEEVYAYAVYRFLLLTQTIMDKI